MKINRNWLGAVGTFGLAAVLSAAAVAQPPERGERGPGQGREGRPEGRPEGGPGGPGGMRAEPKVAAKMMMERFDKDGDGKLDTEELVTALTEMRSMMGGGGPGSGPGGFGGPGGPGGGPGAGQMAARLFEQNDKDGDGKLIGDEIPERMRQGLARIDTNGDEAIDRDELEKMMSSFRGGPGGAGGPGAGRGREGGPESDRPKRPAAEE